MADLGDLAGCCERAQQERKTLGWPGAEQAETVARDGEDDARRIAFRSVQGVAAGMAVALHVADGRLGGTAALPLTADGRGESVREKRLQLRWRGGLRHRTGAIGWRGTDATART